ncbi:MAG: hypothetical protein ACJ75H_13425 [Thermoanaerobaculia bacterium]
MLDSFARQMLYPAPPVPVRGAAHNDLLGQRLVWTEIAAFLKGIAG